ncbi:MAG: ligase-associated DNA damage response DEXH box helicase [Gemmatimonadaceae bacterium]|jgi:ATP-dependent Lhr-like helicase|nr:ligase-associated DNA damage response DEXH box helicase [Gemmatimonadaceae bacterium]
MTTPLPSHAPIDRWFASRGWSPFAFQREVWDAYARGESGLVHAATGTGKTYAAWLGPLLEAVSRDAPTSARGTEPLRVLWLTPLRALAADTERALRDAIDALGVPFSIESRTGDTKASVRARQRERLPSALVTTPESLSLLLCRPDHATLFASLRCVIVDEWHELMSTKRGAQTELALARLRAVAPDMRTWGLSATLGNLEEARDTLLGRTPDGRPRTGRLVRGLVPKDIVVESLVPEEMDRFPWAGHLNVRLLPQVLDRLERAESAIVFTNTRSQCELWFQSIVSTRPEWFEFTAIHHGSLDVKERRAVEDGLRSGRYRIVVATSSLDLGVDFSPVDLVLQIGSPKGVARLLQRAGRSGHSPGRPSRIVCVPTHALELVEVSAARDAMRANAIESREPVDRPLDLLVQHLVTLALGGGFTRSSALAELHTTRAYAALTDDELGWALDFCTHGGAALAAYPEYARLAADESGVYRAANPQVARRHVLNIGTIVSDTAIAVRFLTGGRLGTVEESFVARLAPGDVFLFSGRALEFVRVRDLVAWVRKAKSRANAIPRWQGARMPLSTELAAAVRDTLDAARRGVFDTAELQAVRPVLSLQAERSAIPAPDELLVERCETKDGHHLFVYPFEGRLVHEGLSALFAYRLAQLGPISFTFACNDYGFELLAPERAPFEEALDAGLLSTQHLLHDIVQSLNAAELARRQFREIARVAGLIFTGYPGQQKSMKHVQASSGLLYDVFTRHDPDNLLVRQAQREVLERQLEASRLGRVLARLSTSTVRLQDVERPTPLAFPLLIDRTREKISTEKLADRVRRMTTQLGKRTSPARETRFRRVP